LLRWLKIFSKETILSKINEVAENRGKKVLATILFGSYVYSPRKAKDIDMIVIVDNLKNINDKITLEVEISRKLRKLFRKNIDIQVFDIESFEENLIVGTFLTGLVLGYKIIHDTIGVEKKIQEFIKEISKEDKYVFIKKRKWNLAAIAKAKSRT